jgi:hypothetical protein
VNEILTIIVFLFCEEILTCQTVCLFWKKILGSQMVKNNINKTEKMCFDKK